MSLLEKNVDNYLNPSKDHDNIESSSSSSSLDLLDFKNRTTLSTVLDLKDNIFKVDRSNPEKYLVVLRFATDHALNKDVVASPRNTSPRIFLKSLDKKNDQCAAPYIRWLDSNIGDYLRYKNQWEMDVYPQKVLYVHGAQGLGKLSYAIDTCKESKMNMLFVRHVYYEANMFYDIFKKAKQMQPCMVFFENYDWVLAKQEIMFELHAAYQMLIEPRIDGVWTLISTSVALASMCPEAFLFLKKYGAVTHISVCNYSQRRLYVIKCMLRNITGIESYPYSDCSGGASEGEWSRLLDTMNRYCEYCTFREIWDFIVTIFREYKQYRVKVADNTPRSALTSSYTNIIPHQPTLAFIKAKLDRLPFRRDSNASDNKTLIIDYDPVALFADSAFQWNEFMSQHPAVCVSPVQLAPPSPVISLSPLHISTNTPPLTEDPISRRVFHQNNTPSPQQDYTIQPLRHVPPPPPLPTSRPSYELKKPSSILRLPPPPPPPQKIDEEDTSFLSSPSRLQPYSKPPSPVRPFYLQPRDPTPPPPSPPPYIPPPSPPRETIPNRPRRTIKPVEGLVVAEKPPARRRERTKRQTSNTGLRNVESPVKKQHLALPDDDFIF